MRVETIIGMIAAGVAAAGPAALAMQDEPGWVIALGVASAIASGVLGWRYVSTPGDAEELAAHDAYYAPLADREAPELHDATVDL